MAAILKWFRAGSDQPGDIRVCEGTGVIPRDEEVDGAADGISAAMDDVLDGFCRLP